jgi:hypothetical protein
MTEDLHIDNDLPFSPGEGWRQMELLLDKTLPVSHKKTGRNLLLSCVPAFLLSTIFLFSFLRLDTALFNPGLNNNSIVFDEKISGTVSFSPQRNIGSHYSKPTKMGVNSVTEKEIFLLQKFRSINESSPGQNELSPVHVVGDIEKIGIENLVKSGSEKQLAVVSQKTESFRFNPTASNASTGNKKDRDKMRWNISAGVGINLMPGDQQNLKPYPVAEMKYHLSSRFFIAAGASIFSPAPGKVSGTNKTVYVNDTINNISLYNEVTTYHHFHYADIPVSFGMNVSKKLSVQSGLQVSFLQHKKSTKILQPYDFQMNNIPLPPNTTTFVAAANPQQEFNVQVRNVDYRFIAGIRYQLKRISTGLFYQQALQPTGSLYNNNKTTNQFISLNLLYQIK